MLVAETIAERCGVDVATAKRWKSGKSRIPYAAGVVLSGDLGGISSAWHGWRLQGDQLISPDDERISLADPVTAMRAAGKYGYSSIAQFITDLQEQLGQKAVQGLEDQPLPPPDPQ